MLTFKYPQRDTFKLLYTNLFFLPFNCTESHHDAQILIYSEFYTKINIEYIFEDLIIYLNVILLINLIWDIIAIV
jgi:hypothetical protein